MGTRFLVIPAFGNVCFDVCIPGYPGTGTKVPSTISTMGTKKVPWNSRWCFEVHTRVPGTRVPWRRDSSSIWFVLTRRYPGMPCMPHTRVPGTMGTGITPIWYLVGLFCLAGMFISYYKHWHLTLCAEIQTTFACLVPFWYPGRRH
jgi:hypothetical protein